MTEQLAAALPAAFLGPVCEVVHDRLTGRGRPLTDLDVPPYLMKHVAARYDLAWLRPVSGFRRAAESGAPYEELARLLLEAGVPVRLPAQLLDAVAGWTLTEGPDGLEQVARAMDAAAPSSPGPRLYGALTRDDRHPGLRDMLTEHSRHQRAWHEAVLAELWHRRPGARRPPHPPPRWNAPACSGRWAAPSPGGGDDGRRPGRRPRRRFPLPAGGSGRRRRAPAPRRPARYGPRRGPAHPGPGPRRPGRSPRRRVRRLPRALRPARAAGRGRPARRTPASHPGDGGAAAQLLGAPHAVLALLRHAAHRPCRRCSSATWAVPG
ncbi:hypothetical protein ACW23B_01845 [Streptomyces albidoflavus]